MFADGQVSPFVAPLFSGRVIDCGYIQDEKG